MTRQPHEPRNAYSTEGALHGYRVRPSPRETDATGRIGQAQPHESRFGLKLVWPGKHERPTSCHSARRLVQAAAVALRAAAVGHRAPIAAGLPKQPAAIAMDRLEPGRFEFERQLKSH